MLSESLFIGSNAHVTSATSPSKASGGHEGASRAPVRSAAKRSYAWVRGALACVLAVTSASGCAAGRFRYDRMQESDGVDMRELEDLLRDGSAPMQAEQVEYDFTAERDEYKLGRNDVLAIAVMGHPEIGSPRVRPDEVAGTTIRKDGHVHLPVVGPVPAAGLTITEFEQHLRDAAARFIVSPQVSVEIVRHESQKFFVLGQVRQPGAFAVDGDTTVLEGLSLAGGVPAETADLATAVVVRDGTILPIDLAEMLERGDTSRNVYMRAGDVVYVPTRADAKVYVLGEVQQPRVVPITGSRMTLAEALASAGGPTPGRARRELAVIRGGFAKPVVYRIDLEQALLVDEQVLLRAGDRVVIAPTGLSTANRWMVQILPFLQGAQAIGLAASGGTTAAKNATAAVLAE